ncbi:MAG TPA: nuclear transport factor 2 family protein [Halococcus sp.]|nr:nuclear transport factor 2 family protein [Halococcus sp.]
MTTTDEILDHHLTAFGEQDIDGTMEDYTDDSVVITQSGTYRGLDAISEWFEDELFTEFAKPDVSFSLDERTVEDEYAYIVWHAETPDNEYEFATDTFVIRDGNIVAQTLGAVVTPKN